MREIRVESRTGIIHLGELMRLGDGAQVRRKGKGGDTTSHMTDYVMYVCHMIALE